MDWGLVVGWVGLNHHESCVHGVRLLRVCAVPISHRELRGLPRYRGPQRVGLWRKPQGSASAATARDSVRPRFCINICTRSSPHAFHIYMHIKKLTCPLVSLITNIKYQVNTLRRRGRACARKKWVLGWVLGGAWGFDVGLVGRKRVPCGAE